MKTTLDMFVTLNNGVRVRAQFTALESPDADFFDDENAIARLPDHLEVIEAANLFAAAQGERFTERTAS